MAEDQGQHRHEIEKLLTEANIEGMRRQFWEARLGQVFAFVLSVAFLVSGVYLVVHNQPLAGSVLGTMGISGIVGSFIKGRGNAPSTPETPPEAKKKRKRG